MNNIKWTNEKDENEATRNNDINIVFTGSGVVDADLHIITTNRYLDNLKRALKLKHEKEKLDR
jgi:hypothetical protein